nr:MAG: wsv222-like protein [Metapenaeus ensis nimavirus]
MSQHMWQFETQHRGEDEGLSSQIAHLLTRNPVEVDHDKIRETFKKVPMVMHADYNGQLLWSYIFSYSNPEMINFILSCRAEKVLSIPDPGIPMTINGNGILMADVKLFSLGTLLTKDRDYFFDALAFVNSKDGNNFFHHHSGKLTSFDVLMWLSEIYKIVPEEDLADLKQAFPNVNLPNRDQKTPLQIAIMCNNPGAVHQLISDFGAFWFNECVVEHDNGRGKKKLTTMSYIELAEKLNMDECTQIPHKANKSYRIQPNIGNSRDLECAICKGTETYEEYYKPECGHTAHCICLMRVCATSAHLKCPSCRNVMTGLEEISPPTIYRTRYITRAKCIDMCLEADRMDQCVKYATEMVINYVSGTSGPQSEGEPSFSVPKRPDAISTSSGDYLHITHGDEMPHVFSQICERFLRPDTTMPFTTHPPPISREDHLRYERPSRFLRATPRTSPFHNRRRRENRRGPLMSNEGPQMASNTSVVWQNQRGKINSIFKYLRERITYRLQLGLFDGIVHPSNFEDTLVSAAITVATGFACEMTYDIDTSHIRRLIRRETLNPTFCEVFGDRHSCINENQLFEEQGLSTQPPHKEYSYHSFHQFNQRGLDIDMIREGIAPNQIEVFFGESLERLLMFLFDFLYKDPSMDNISSHFIVYIEKMITDVLEEHHKKRKGFPLDGCLRERITTSLSRWAGHLITSKFQNNAVWWMRYFLERHEEISCRRSIDRWIRLTRECEVTRNLMTTEMITISRFLGERLEADVSNFYALLDLVVQTCYVLM